MSNASPKASAASPRGRKGKAQAGAGPAVVVHPELGDGVVLGAGTGGFLRVFFRTVGERQIPPDSLSGALPWNERVIQKLLPATRENVARLRMALDAFQLPLTSSATRLTAAKVDLLPHQVVLVHRVATSRPRRFLVADEVGLGKTVETALILRELASRGELTRALMVVPAGLVENWRRELNDVFNLDFEVFGSGGDVTDRKTNAFARHPRLIASIDTLKRPARIQRILGAPPWDLVVFDEAQHLTAYRQGNRVVRTENFKLAEALRDHCRDLLLLSATPHQGDHFRFWQLVRVLEPSLFTDAEDLVRNRHRLNAVVIRRTKADACDKNGGTLFARRSVHTERFRLTAAERAFYEALTHYIKDGYDLARQLGGKGSSLGLVMTIFQKIASSSFSAVKSTLTKRLLMLTVQEALHADDVLDVDRRDAALADARGMLRAMHGLGVSPFDNATVERLLADAKMVVLKKQERDDERDDASEVVLSATGEDTAANLVATALPEERRRIGELLMQFPRDVETKTHTLVKAVGALLAQNPSEKAVVFTTYLGSVEALRAAVSAAYPHVQVDVLKGGDHGAKTAAQNRFKSAKGAAVLICTAAGREGINLQFCRVLFNHDLPWNPMDLEQRIGRIHRYGQKDTAQVFNMVAEDTIEGQVYDLLEEKLDNIAAALGKVDERGHVAEDFRAQILGQLAEHLKYEELYRQSLGDPKLARTKEELAVAMDNAVRSRRLVGELFQDLQRFNLDEYRQLDDQGQAMAQLLSFSQKAAEADGGSMEPAGPERWSIVLPGKPQVSLTTNRDVAMSEEGLALLGLELPQVRIWLERWTALAPEARGMVANASDLPPGITTVWRVTVEAKTAQRTVACVIGLDGAGHRQPGLENLERVFGGVQPLASGASAMEPTVRRTLLRDAAPKVLHRHLEHAGLLADGAHYTSSLLAWVEVGHNGGAA
jgi:superfamily II DNA or RNA helicase